MNLNSKIVKLKGCVQNYEWGGREFIPALLGINNNDQKPYAEYWMGAHPRATSTIETAYGKSLSLYEFISTDAKEIIGEKVYNRFGELPFLFKILDVRDMLSIQVHPSKAEAVKGFEAEDAAGIPLDAPHRNYKDKNHKPEVMIALSDFYLLHGFKNETLLRQTLQAVPEFHSLKNIFNEEGYVGLYKTVMEMAPAESDALLRPLIEREMNLDQNKMSPGFWVKKLFEKQTPSSGIDKGIFSIYFFNIVHLQKGEAIYQGAGVPHAYLQGQNVELMANSDNVLRAGLTPKHIDVAELLKHTVFEGIDPEILRGSNTNQIGEQLFVLPVDDFGISSIHLQADEKYSRTSFSAEIMLVMEGKVLADGGHYHKGEVIFIMAGANYTIQAESESLLYRAFVPLV